MKNTYEQLDKDTVARWITLLSAIDTLDRFCQQNNQNFDDIEIKIPAIKHYMEDTLASIKTMQKEDEMFESNKTINNIKARVAKNFLNNIVTQPKSRSLVTA